MEDAIFPLRLEDILVGALCVWRLTHLLHIEDGPFAALARLRRAFGRFAGAFDCFYCLSLWVTPPFAYLIGANWTQRLLLWPALSGAACLLHQFASRPNFPAMIYEDKEP